MHRAEASGADVQAALGGLQTLGSVGARQAQDAEASPEALPEAARMRSWTGRSRNKRVGVHLACAPGSSCAGAAADCAGGWRRGRPWEQLHRLVGDAGLDHLAHQAVGHGIEMPASRLRHGNPDPPGSAAIKHRRKLGLLTARGAEMAHRPVVSAISSRTAPLSSASEKKRRCRSTLNDLHGGPWPCRGGAAPARAVSRCRNDVPDPRLIATGGGDGLEIVADDLPRDAAEAREGTDMAADPVRQRLCPSA